MVIVSLLNHYILSVQFLIAKYFGVFNFGTLYEGAKQYFGVFNFGTLYEGAKIGQNKTTSKISRFTVIDGKLYGIFTCGTKKQVREMGGVRAIRV